MNFEGFKSVTSSNSRKANAGTGGPKGQEYADLKYRRAAKKVKGQDTGNIEGRFYISNTRFLEWGLEGENGNGLRQFTDPTGATVLGIVAGDNAVVLKNTARGKKSKHFKSTRLEAALDGLKAIDATLQEGEKQYITLTEVAANVSVDGVPCIKVYSLAKGAGLREESSNAPAAAAPKAAPVKAEADWD